MEPSTYKSGQAEPACHEIGVAHNSVCARHVCKYVNGCQCSQLANQPASGGREQSVSAVPLQKVVWHLPFLRTQSVKAETKIKALIVYM